MLSDEHRHIPVHIQLPMRKAQGGLASSAQHVADAGTGGDSMIVHINKAEFEKLRQELGEPTVNPKTGMPSFSWGDWLGPLAGVVSGVTGIGGDVGGWLGNAVGADLSPAVSSALGSALIGGGLGALGGGGKGALYGGLAGGAAGYFGGGDNQLAGLFGGAGGASGATGALQGPTTSGATLDAVGKSGSSGGGLGSLFNFSGKDGGTKALLMGLVAANALGGNKGPSKDAQAAAAQQAQQTANFNRPLPAVSFNRTQAIPQGFDPKRYGMNPSQNFFMQNQLPQPTAQGYARGGLSSIRPPQPTGRSDDIPARLSEGEYVIDAETTALLGDGSTKAGAAKLDAMRENIRRHKGGALARGAISPDAGAPEQYIPGGR